MIKICTIIQEVTLHKTTHEQFEEYNYLMTETVQDITGLTQFECEMFWFLTWYI